MGITIFILILLPFFVVATFLVLVRRNDNVLKFRIWIIDLIAKSSDPNKALDTFKTVSYEKMLYSWKKLELDSFYTSEELKIMLE